MTVSSIGRVEHVLSLRDRIGGSLAAAIVSGELAPGTLVTVPTLAAQFEVSATPVREALLDLKQRGFVESVRNKGFRVTAVSSADLREIVELRELLEAPAMRALAAGFPVQTMPRWRRMADEIMQHAHKSELAEFIEADRAFHLGLLELHENRRLVDLVAELRSQTRMVNLVKMTHSAELNQVAEEHHHILDLLEAEDGEALEKLMHQHLAHVIDWWEAKPSN